MFFPGSRYYSLATYQFKRADGSAVQATRLPAPGVQAVLGYYRRNGGDRLDQIAGRFLSDATMFWHVCDANGALVPDALAAHNLVGVPIDAGS
ncbi:MAG TPA: hypothetical protein VGX91_13605 [Candidatus Cybelea sp.]|jgi:hypothetical protein|nr:hypothetical protein [Candidatus Cybelea sp.]